MLEPLLYLALMTFAALGSGGIVLRLLGITAHLKRSEVLAFSMPLGMGLLGWMVFFFLFYGASGKIELTVLMCIFSFFSLSLRPLVANGLEETRIVIAHIIADRWRLLLLFILVLAIVFDISEAFSPPVDGDSMAYHFALPKFFLKEGILTPMFQAVEGSIPLLIHMTYLAALGTGGEQTLTLWVMITGYFTTYLFFVILKEGPPT